MSEMSEYLPPGTYSGSMNEPQSTMSKVGSFAVSATDCLFTMASHSTSTRFTLMPVFAVNSAALSPMCLPAASMPNRAVMVSPSAAFASFCPPAKRDGREKQDASRRALFPSSWEPPWKDFQRELA